jgi:uncharacterized protein YcbX
MSSVMEGDSSLVELWRYPVKSMMGEELDASLVTERGLLGDRAYALIDQETGKVVSAKEPRKWPTMFEFRSAYLEPPGAGLPPVRITLPDGTSVSSEQDELPAVLSSALGRKVTFEEAQGMDATATAEEYWPDMDGLDYRDTVTDFDLPQGTFFDAASVHLVTTATLAQLGALYPDGRFEVRRFRPNMVIAAPSGETGFVENDWVDRTVAVGDDVRLRVMGPCPRCVMTTLPQGDLPKDPGILRTAAQHNGANVGVYASVVQGGQVAKGDSVRLL